jgi:hypothetical protein
MKLGLDYYWLEIEQNNGDCYGAYFTPYKEEVIRKYDNFKKDLYKKVEVKSVFIPLQYLMEKLLQEQSNIRYDIRRDFGDEK